MKTEKPKIQLNKVLIYVILIVIAIFTITPIFLVWSSAFKTRLEISQNPLALPSSLYIEGIIKAWKIGNFARYSVNSIIISSFSVFLNISLCALAAYPCAKLKFKGCNLFLILFLIGFTLPFQALMIPLFRLMQSFHILSTYAAVFLPQVAFGLSFGIFMLITFFKEIPNEIIEYSHMEGANHFVIFTKIIIPLAKSAISSLAIFAFIASWNDFIMPLLFIQSESLRPLTLGLMFFKTRFGTDYSLIFPGIVIIILPVMIFYFIFSRSVMKGLTAGAVKG